MVDDKTHGKEGGEGKQEGQRDGEEGAPASMSQLWEKRRDGRTV